MANIGLTYDHKPCFIIVLIAGCATHIYIFAMTSGEKGSESDSLPYLFLRNRGGKVNVTRLPDNLPGNQQSLNMGDFWRLNLKTDMGFPCLTKSYTEVITLQNGGNDDWGVASIITFLGNGDRYTLLTTDIDVYDMVGPTSGGFRLTIS